jgi:hypothetical protein
MPPDRADDIAEARRWFAMELRHTAHVRSPAVIEAGCPLLSRRVSSIATSTSWQRWRGSASSVVQ